MNKIDITKTIGVIGTLLGVVGTLLSAYASNKDMDCKIEEKVAKALENLKD